MAAILPCPDERRCRQLKANGERCASPALKGADKCRAHSPERYRAFSPSPPVEPSLTLPQLAFLDLSTPEGLAAARTGVWQHLLAGSLEPHVAKVALDVAETIAKAAPKRKDTTTADAVAKLLASTPPPASATDD